MQMQDVETSYIESYFWWQINHFFHYAAFGTGRNYRKSEFRLVNFVRPISLLVFPSRHVGREIPRPSCEYSGLDLSQQTMSRRQWTIK